MREVCRTIKYIGLPLWVEILKDAKPEDYLFNIGLKDGPTKLLENILQQYLEMFR